MMSKVGVGVGLGLELELELDCSALLGATGIIRCSKGEIQ